MNNEDRKQKKIYNSLLSSAAATIEKKKYIYIYNKPMTYIWKKKSNSPWPFVRPLILQSFQSYSEQGQYPRTHGTIEGELSNENDGLGLLFFYLMTLKQNLLLPLGPRLWCPCQRETLL